MDDRQSSSDVEDPRWVALRARLEGLRPVLETQGSLVLLPKRNQRFWYLRYYEQTQTGKKQRSIYVGNGERADRVKALLAEFRAPGEFLRETLRLAEQAQRIVKPLLRNHDRRTLSSRLRN